MYWDIPATFRTPFRRLPQDGECALRVTFRATPNVLLIASPRISKTATATDTHDSVSFEQAVTAFRDPSASNPYASDLARLRTTDGAGERQLPGLRRELNRICEDLSNVTRRRVSASTAQSKNGAQLSGR